MISGTMGNPESMNYLRPSPEYMTLFSKRTISSAGMAFLWDMKEWISLPRAVLRFSSFRIRL